jgi:hypothetical protein
MGLRCYPLFDEPSELRGLPRDLRKAKRYFDWFENQIPERIAALRRAFEANGGEPSVLDLRPRSLADLGAWFDRFSEIRPATPEELQFLHELVPEWAWSYVGRGRMPTDETFSLCVDIGIYFAETLRHQHPALEWFLVRRPKSDADFLMPAIGQFKGAHLNPTRILFNIALSHKDASTELPRLYKCWAEDAP